MVDNPNNDNPAARLHQDKDADNGIHAARNFPMTSAQLLPNDRHKNANPPPDHSFFAKKH